MLRTAVEMRWPDIRQWCINGGMSTAEVDADRNDIVQDVRTALAHCSGGDDGYELAKVLERSAGWSDADSALVGVLDDVCSAVYTAHAAALGRWVAKFGVSPAFKVGDRVTVREGADRWNRTRLRGHVGEVVKVYADRAEYAVFCEELGHVREGSGRSGAPGVLIGRSKLAFKSSIASSYCSL